MGTWNTVSKAALLFLALCFWVVAGGLIYLAVELLGLLAPLEGILEDVSYLAISCWTVIGSTFFLFVLGVLSFFAACSKNKCLQIVFFVVLTVGLAGLITGATFCIMYREQIREDINSSLENAIVKYAPKSLTSVSASNEIDTAVDFLQTNYQCCGVTKYTDWQFTPWGDQHWYMVPLSCCKEMQLDDCSGSTFQEDLYKINQEGCEEPLYNDILGYLILMIIVTLSAALIQIVAMALSCVRLCAFETVEVSFVAIQNEPEVAVTQSSREVQTDWTQGSQETPKPI